MTSDVKILDCTLRDGGYINNWNFGYENIRFIIEKLVESNIDFIECGYLKHIEYDKNRAIYPDIQTLKILTSEFLIKPVLMINYGEYDLKEICSCEDVSLRIAFRKDDLKSALEFAKGLKDKGYQIFLNPMYTNTYSEKELEELIIPVNKIKPYALTIVDSTGGMTSKDALKLFDFINLYLEKDISLDFHSHNNMHQAFMSTSGIIEASKGRNIITDSTVMGMGRGAGNLSTELIIKYLNDNGKYELNPILQIIDKVIEPLYLKTPWGYSIPYYLSALEGCHPDYASFFYREKGQDYHKIELLLKSVPKDKKCKFDEKLAQNLCSQILNI